MRNLIFKWTISKARDTQGYNIVTLVDGDKKYKALGGGYDMQGTVFAHWLWANHKEEIISKLKGREKDFYGFFAMDSSYRIDGACGLDCMITIAKEIGLQVKQIYSKYQLTNIIVE